MASFEQQIEGLTQIPIESSGSAPTQLELNEFIKNGVFCTINRITDLRPDEAVKFTKSETLSDGDGKNLNGKVIGIVRFYDGGDRFATQIPAQVRYDVTDINSFRYRGPYNPVYYILDNKIYVLPTPTDSYYATVTQLNFDTIVDCTIDTELENFPKEYLHLIVYYSSALSCLSAANNLQNNMPIIPAAPEVPDFVRTDVTLPDLPVYSPTNFNINSTLGIARTEIAREDFEKADKYLEIAGKELDVYSKDYDNEQQEFNKDMEVFKSDLDKLVKDSDRETQVEIGEYRSKIYKYQYEITMYSQELQERFTKYKWFVDQYMYYMKEYNEGLMLIAGKPQQPGPGRPPKAPKEEKKTTEEAQQGGY